jgi:uncharacterized protein (TIGR02246 family)
MTRLLMAMSVLVAAPALAQGQSRVAASSAEVIAAAETSWAQAYQTCDVTAMGHLVSDDLVFVHSSGTIEDRAAHLASVRRCPLEVVTIDVTKVRLYGNDTAVVIGTMSGKMRGRDSTFSQLYTRVYIKQMGDWRLVSHHASDAPIKTSTVK